MEEYLRKVLRYYNIHQTVRYGRRQKNLRELTGDIQGDSIHRFYARGSVDLPPLSTNLIATPVGAPGASDLPFTFIEGSTPAGRLSNLPKEGYKLHFYQVSA